MCSFVYAQDDLRSLDKMRIEFISNKFGIATVSWDANIEPDLAGYTIYYGETSGSYNNKMYFGNVTRQDITGLAVNKRYYFAVTATDFSGNESGFSDEVSTTIKEKVILVNQQFSVSADGIMIQSESLVNGVIYEIIVSGTFNFWMPNSFEADADWSQWDNSGTIEWQNKSEVGLLIDGKRINLVFNLNHIYNFEYIGTGAALTFKIFDGYYLDNSGQLDISIKTK